VPGAVNAIRAAAAASFSRAGQLTGLEARLGEVTMPTLVVWGAEDRVIPVAHAFAAARALPDCLLKIMPGVGHVPQVEAAEAFSTAIGRFARGLAALG